MTFRSQMIDPETGRLKPPRTPQKGSYGGKSLDVYSRCRKRRAIARVKLMPLWQGIRLYVLCCIDLGRGERCRTWVSDTAIMEMMNRSGMGTYDLDYVRECRRHAENMGLIRSTRVLPHSHYGCLGAEKCPCGHFPNPKTPDLDGGGRRAAVGGRVKEVNLDGILGLAELWEGPLREMGWLRDHEAANSEAEGPETLTPEPGPEAQKDHCTPAQRMEMDHQGGVVMHPDSCDLHPASQDVSLDPGRSGAPASAPENRVPLRGTETSAHAGGSPARPEAAPLDATAPAARAALDAPPPNGPPRTAQPRARPLEGSGEQAARQGSSAPTPRRRGPSPDEDMLSVFAKMVPKGVASFVADNLGTTRPPDAPEVEWTEGASPKPVTARAPNVGLLFGAAELRPVGHHGERPHGWKPPGGGPGGRT